MDDNPPDRPARTPLWKAIATALRGDIVDGQYLPGDKLPTEALLARRFGVNRHTVRHALATLADEGLVRSRRGSGTVVTARPTDYRLGRRVRFHENLIAEGRRPGKRHLSLETRAATETEARALRVPAGAPVLVLRGISLGDGVPVALGESVFPADRFPGLEAAIRATDSVTAALRAVGLADYTRASTRVTATLADATQALHLQIAEGAPLVRTTSLNVDPDQQPVEFGRTWFAGDRVTLIIET